MRRRVEEYHVTVDSLFEPAYAKTSAFNARWEERGRTLETRLILVSPSLDLERINNAGYAPVRTQHFVSIWLPEERPVYYEGRVTLLGDFRPECYCACRDLFRITEHCWQAVRRTRDPFDMDEFTAQVQSAVAHEHRGRGPSKIVGRDYAACLIDTNPDLDQRWMA